MAASAGTPIDLVSSVYATLPARAALGRKRLERPLTLAEKILINHLSDPENQEIERGLAAVHDRGPAASGRSGHGALRSPHQR
jgi:hypothetical protein